MRLWEVPRHADGPRQVIDLDKLTGLLAEPVSPGPTRAWRLRGVLPGSFVLLLEGSQDLIWAAFEEARDIAAGLRAPYGVLWKGPSDGA